MRNTSRRFVIGQGNRFLSRWWVYKSYLMQNGWGYATNDEILIASHAVRMETENAVKYINSRVLSRDSSLRVASVMKNMDDDLLTIRLTLATLGFDVTVFLPKKKGDCMLQRLIRVSGVETNCVSLTELSMILAMALPESEGKERREMETAMRVSAMGLKLLRYGVEVENHIRRTFMFESKVAGALIDSAFEEGDEAATAFANDITRDLINEQKTFENTMDLMYGVCLN